jgi:hypothetical protein
MREISTPAVELDCVRLLDDQWSSKRPGCARRCNVVMKEKRITVILLPFAFTDGSLNRPTAGEARFQIGRHWKFDHLMRPSSVDRKERSQS